MTNLVVSLRRAVLASALGVVVTGLAGAAHAKNGGVGWQGVYTYTVPTGWPNGFFTYDCPAGLVARSGAFFPNPTFQAQGINLGVNGPRIDGGNYNAWGFEYNIPGGAPAGQTILFDVYCTKGPV